MLMELNKVEPRYDVVVAVIRAGDRAEVGEKLTFSQGWLEGPTRGRRSPSRGKRFEVRVEP